MKNLFSSSLLLLAGIMSIHRLAAAEKPSAVTLGSTASSANTDADEGIEIQAGTDSSKATLKWSTEVSDKTVRIWTASASAPLDKGSDFTRIAAFDGFPNSFSLSGGLTMYLPSDAMLAGFNASAGHRNFKYTDTVSLAQAKASRTPFAGGAFLGTKTAKWDQGVAFTLLGAEYKEEYKDQDPKGVVLPADTSGREFVQTGPYGRPKRSVQMLLSLDHRVQINRGDKPKVRTGLKVTYDFKSKEYGAEIPVIFLHGEKDAKWTGGLLFGYQSEDHRFYGAIVVGAPFQIISSP